jgi:hypothetical protein
MHFLTDPDGARYEACAGVRRSSRRSAGVAVYERGAHGKLAAARIYDGVDPPLALSGRGAAS